MAGQGGKREGSGQKPGHCYEKRHQSHSEAVLGAFRDATTTDAPRQDAAVSVASNDPQLLTVAALAAQGLSWSAIERRTTRDRMTCQRWRDAYPEVFERAVREFTGLSDPKQAMAHLIPDSIRTVANVLDPDYSGKDSPLAAATHVQAYVWDKPMGRTEVTGDISVSINFGSIEPPTIEHRPSTISESPAPYLLGS